MTRSVWYRLGCWFGLARAFRRSGASIREAYWKAYALHLAVEIGREVTDSIEEATKGALNRMRSRRPGPPPIPPTKQAELAMPTRAPNPPKPVLWPPFTGVRVELGGDTA